MLNYKKEFIELALEYQALRFGKFELKSGRISPYFFNAGLFNTGAALARLGRLYAQAIVASNVQYDMLFGPAYKGIPLAATTAVAMADRHDRDLPYCFNRKEAKQHGEGGSIVGATLSGKVLIIDDVITAGTAIREALSIIKSKKAVPAAIIIGLDRQEKGLGQYSAIEELHRQTGVRVISIIQLEDIINFLTNQDQFSEYLDQINIYRDQYGI